jgi:hypothetical protein
MPDRVLRDELWLSDRFLDLASDAARVAFLRFLSLADDFGNFEGGERRLSRILIICTQLKTDNAVSLVIDSLMACDLIRRYTVQDRELFHIPRFRSHRQYVSRRYPASPWCDQNADLGKYKRVKNQSLAKNAVTTSLLRSSVVAEGDGAGVEDGEDQETSTVGGCCPPLLRADGASPPPKISAPKKSESKATRLPEGWQLPKAWGDWALAEYPQWSAEKVRLEGAKFADHWSSKSGADATKVRWEATWRNWCRSDIAHRDDKPHATAPNGHQDRKQRQLATAAALTGSTPHPQPPKETFDVDARIIAS